MKLFSRTGFIFVMMIIVLVSTACGGNNSPTGVAKTFFEGLLKADAATIRSVLCEARIADAKDEIFDTMSDATKDGNFDLSNVTYTYSEAAKIVTLGGIIRATVRGVSVDVPASNILPYGLPVIEEGGNWRVCSLLGGAG